MPADILPSATATPVGMVYDADGAVTDALLGVGSSSECFSNAAFGGPDAFTPDGHIAHALVVLDGDCAQTNADLLELKYRLVRVLGRVFGLGWSQMNLNVITGSPRATTDDKLGFPLMHGQDAISCVPISVCQLNADQPKMDDRASLARLYPVTSQNLAQFPGKRVFSTSTARIHGSVRFTDGSGNRAQPMQGVNVVARWIDPGTRKPSTQYAVASVSGFLFCGNAGNAVTGYNDPLGQPYNRFGSNDSALEGFFDLAGLEIPVGTSAQVQLSVEAVDSSWSTLVGPYAPLQVLPSGSAQPIVVGITQGGDVQQDILMSGSATEIAEAGETGTFDAPRTLSKDGEWIGSLSGYGNADYFVLNGQANRTTAVEITALDENGNVTQQKVQPVIGMWSLAAPDGTPPPAYTFSPFNIGHLGVTRLSAELLSGTQFRIGIADLRGDGRPDYRYRAHVLYGDTVTPARVSVQAGTPIALAGLGFKPGDTVLVGGANSTLLGVSPAQLTALAPRLVDGVQSITITDPANGASTTLENAVTAGAGPNDLIRMTLSGNSPTPVGGEAPNPIRVVVATADGSTPVGGATVQWSVTNGAGLAACGGAASCSVLTDESGKVETRVRVGATGTSTVTATLAPASYTPAKFVQAAISGTSSAKDLVVSNPKVQVAQGATIDVPLTARLLANGAPVSGQTLNFLIGLGSGTVNPASAVTDSNGYAYSTLRLSSFAGDLQGNVCVAPGNNPCQPFYALMAAATALRLENVAGSFQAITAGQMFQPLVVRVTDSASPPNPVLGASVLFQDLLFLPDADESTETAGETATGQYAMKVLLASSQSNVLTDGSGLASMMPPAGGLNRTLEAEITASTGASAVLQFEWLVLPALAQDEGSGGSSAGVISASEGAGRKPAAENAGSDCGARTYPCGAKGVGSPVGQRFPLAYRRVEP